MEFVHIDWDFPKGLSSVSVEEHFVFLADFANSSQVLDDSDFIIHSHDTHAESLFPACLILKAPFL